jgi:ABC-2 type transport system ATP-binding protein
MTLVDAGDKPVKTYSGGMRRRLDLAASLIGRPPILFLDEPTTGLDPRTRNDLWALIEELVAEGTTVLLTTQYMEEAEHLAHRIVVMDSGRVVAQGTADELKDHLGGNVLEVQVVDRVDLDKAAALIVGLAGGPPRVDPDLRQISFPIDGGANVLIAAGRALGDAGIDVEDLGIRRPSLDEVFLSLTGHTTTPQSGRTAPATGDTHA